MDYIVRHRDKTGSIVETQYSADDRHGLYERLAADHITAISVREGKLKALSAGKTPFAVRAVAVAVVLAVVGVGMYLYLSGKADAPVEAQNPKTRRAKPAELPPVVIETKSDQTQVVEHVEKPLGPQQVGEVRDGYVLLPNGKLHKRNGLMKVDVKSWNNKSRYQIFDTYTDNEIATLLTLQPGDMLIGGGVFPPNYEERFLKSLETPIEISPDDPEDIADVKRAVIATRKELKEALDNGEDIRAIVKGAYEEAQKLAAYKDTINEAIRDLRNRENLTETDIDAFEKAANMMLEEQGIAPIKIGILTRHRLLNLKK